MADKIDYFADVFTNHGVSSNLNGSVNSGINNKLVCFFKVLKGLIEILKLPAFMNNSGISNVLMR